MTEADKDEILQLHKQGLTQREIAERTGRPAGTISTFCSRNGLKFDGTTTEAATARRVLDAKERVSLLRLELIAVQEHRVAEIRAVQNGEKKWKTVLRGTGASEGEAELSFIPPNDYAREQSAASQASTAIKNYAPQEVAKDTTATDSVVDALLTGFRQHYDTAVKPAKVGDET
jgi:transcriptional regulator with XRE-family HTH domain